MPCGDSYDSHVWGWVGERHVCTLCGVEDMAGRRIVRTVLGRLRALGRVR